MRTFLSVDLGLDAGDGVAALDLEVMVSPIGVFTNICIFENCAMPLSAFDPIGPVMATVLKTKRRARGVVPWLVHTTVL
jgi:hypothetical protein